MGYGRVLSVDQDALSWGVSLKYIQQSLASYSASAVAADIGVMKPLTVASLPARAALAVRNIGTTVTFLDEGYPLPLEYTAGFFIAAKTFDATLDLSLPNDNDMYWALGTQYHVHKMLALRLGYNSRQRSSGTSASFLSSSDQRLEAFNGMSVGFGVAVPLRAQNDTSLTIDYALVPNSTLGSSHKISVGLQW